MKNEDESTRLQVAPAPYVRIKLFALMSGYTENALRAKIEVGKWIEGREFRRSPDGEILISVHGVTRWIEGRTEK
jgi:hypothetical protein